MADRVLAMVADERDPRHVVEIERSAAGKPGGMVVTYFEGQEQASVMVANLYDLLMPMAYWLEVAPSDLPDRQLLDAHDAAMIRADHLLREIRRRLLRSTDDQ